MVAVLARMAALSALVAAAELNAGAEAAGVIAKVMSFNVRTSLAGVDRQATCSNWFGVRKDNVVGQFMSADADFVGTQETSEEQRAELDGALAATYKSIGESGGSLNGNAPEVNAIYYKFSKWSMLTQGIFWFGPNPEAPSSDWGMQYYRTCVYGRFQHIESGKTVCVLNTHYETPGNDLAQTEASKIILRKLGEVCDPGDAFSVVTGDFNAKRNYPAIQELLNAGLVDTSDEPTFCGDMIQPTCHEKFDFTLSEVRNGACALDEIVVRQEFSGCYPSDHAVVITDYCLGGSCCGDADDNADGAASKGTNGSASGDNATGSKAAGSGAVRDADGKLSSVDTNPGSVVAGDADTLPADAAGTKGTAKETRSGEKDGSAQSANTQSEGTTNATGTVFTIVGVLAGVGAVCAFVVKKKRALDAELDGQKAAFAPAPSFFTRAEEDALSPTLPVSSTAGYTDVAGGATGTAVAGHAAGRRSNSSPLPTLELGSYNQSRTASQASSIAFAGRATNGPQSSVYIANSSIYGESVDRLSSPVMLGDDGRSTNESSSRGSSRIYFSEVVGNEENKQVAKRGSSEFALL